MTFQPFVPFAGYSGWTFLSRTLPEQTAAFAASPALDRDMTYFRENIGAVKSADDLVGDFRLLRVALGAFGLQEDMPNKAFIRTVLAKGVSEGDALANRLADKRYRAFSEAFGFGTSLPPKSGTPGFADRILARFERQEFERAIGTQNEDMRLALTATRELPEIAERDLTNDAAWFTIMGNPPLRKIFETAFGLPSGVGGLDLDRQLQTFEERSEQVLGRSDVAQFREPEQVEELIQAYLTRSQLNSIAGVNSPASIALTLLQGAV